MGKRQKVVEEKVKYCEVEPKECDGKCCYAKGKNKKGSR